MAEKTPYVEDGWLYAGAHHIALASPEWQAWLQNNDKFIFRSAAGRFTARCELRASGRYWYGYRRRDGQLRKAYLGKSDNLTPACLHEAAGNLNPIDTIESTSDRAVVHTKVMPPPLGSHVVARPDKVSWLAEQVDAGRHVLVAAPTGFGKTTLLTQWARHLDATGWHIAWVACDKADADVNQFLSSLVYAVQRAHPAAAASATDYVRQSGYLDSADVPLTLLMNDAGRLSEPLVIFLDDVHHLTSPSSQDVLAFLLHRAPTNVLLIAAGRTIPPVKLGRLRAQGRLAELDTHHLRLSPPHAEALLTTLAGQSLPADALSTLHERTGGWAAALQLAGLSLQQADDPRTFVDSFSGQHRHIVDYLTEEVLAHLPQESVLFLQQTATLERFTAPLCDYVTGRSDSVARLHELEERNLLLIPLDEHRRWYRYHPLFAQALQSHLYAQHAGDISTLHQRASTWFEQEGMIAEAIGHRLADDDSDYAAGLIERAFFSTLLGGEPNRVLGWLHQLPADLVDQWPNLCLAYAASYIVDGRYTLADPYITALETVPRAAGTDALYHMVAAHNAHWRGHVAQSVAHAQAGLAAIHEIDPTSPFHDDIPGITTAIWVILAASYFVQGRLHDVLETVQPLLSQVDPDTLPADAFSMIAALHSLLSEVYYEWGDLDRAEYHAQQCIDGGKRSGYSAYEASGGVLLGRVRRARGKPREAEALIHKAARTMLTLGIADDLHDSVLAEAVLTLLRAGDIEGAAKKLTTYRAIHPITAAKRMQHHILQMVHVRVLLAQKRRQQAKKQLSTLLEEAEAGGWSRSLIEMRLIQALTAYEQGDQATAFEHMAAALRLAEPGGHLRTFMDEGAPLLSLLLRMQAAYKREQVDELPMGYVARLVAAFEGEAVGGDIITHSELTPRELDVVRLLGQGLSNAEIAARLIITEGTVKRHLHSIYGKLGVSSRSEAQARVRALNLLE